MYPLLASAFVHIFVDLGAYEMTTVSCKLIISLICLRRETQSRLLIASFSIALITIVESTFRPTFIIPKKKCQLQALENSPKFCNNSITDPQIFEKSSLPLSSMISNNASISRFLLPFALLATSVLRPPFCYYYFYKSCN